MKIQKVLTDKRPVHLTSNHLQKSEMTLQVGQHCLAVIRFFCCHFYDVRREKSSTQCQRQFLPLEPKARVMPQKT